MIRQRLSHIYGFTQSLLNLLLHLPGYAPFAPLVWRATFSSTTAAAVADNVPGRLTQAECDWLATVVRRTRPDAIIVQAGLPEADATCALAAGCWASDRRVFALWPEDAGDVSVREWHRTIIRQGFAPYVTPVVGVRECARPIDLFFAEGSAEPPMAAKIIVRRRTPDAPGQFDSCGTLTASKPGAA